MNKKSVKLTKKDIARGVVLMTCPKCGQTVKSLNGRPFLHPRSETETRFACNFD